MEIWKTLRVSHIPTPPATTTDNCPTRRYTNIPLGTKNRSGQSGTADCLFVRAALLSEKEVFCGLAHDTEYCRHHSLRGRDDARLWRPDGGGFWIESGCGLAYSGC